MLHYTFLALFLICLAWIGVIVYRKIPLLAAIPSESLPHQEPFRFFVVRMAKKALFALNPRRITMHFLMRTAQLSNHVRILFLDLSGLIEMLAKKTRHMSQKMQWEHHWFSEKEARTHREDSADSAQQKEKHTVL